MEDDEPRPVSPVMIVIALGVIAAMLFPFYEMFVDTPRSRELVAKGFGFVFVVMAALAVFGIFRALSRRRE